MTENEDIEINSIGYEKDWDGIKKHVPRACDSCFKPRSAQYGKDNKWFCLRCWIGECSRHRL